MKTMRFTPKARLALDAQVGYLFSIGAIQAGLALAQRVDQYLTTVVASFPRAATFIRDRNIWE